MSYYAPSTRSALAPLYRQISHSIARIDCSLSQYRQHIAWFSSLTRHGKIEEGDKATIDEVSQSGMKEYGNDLSVVTEFVPGCP